MKTIGKILLVTALAFVPAGVSLIPYGDNHSKQNPVDYSRYNFQGKIGKEDVSFLHIKNFIGERYNHLVVNDGTKVEYFDNLNNDLKVDYVTVDGRMANTKKNSRVLQKQFDDYLVKILEVKK